MKQHTKRAWGYWTDENIVKEILQLNEQGVALNAKNVDEVFPSLRSAAKKNFGNWRVAIEKSGLNYDHIKKTKPRTKESIIKELLKRKNNNLPLSQTELQKDNQALFSACVNHFGSYEKALNRIGVNYSEVRIIKKWTKETVIDALNERIESKLSLAPTEVSRDDRYLYCACSRIFGSYEAALEEVKVEYQSELKNQYWSKNSIIKEIVSLNKQQIPLNSTFMESKYPSLYAACRNHFGNYQEAILQAGLDYDQIREDKKLINHYGYKFEDLVGEILEALRLNYQKGFNREYQPDFVLRNGVWIDAKLSEWNPHKYTTIEKYEPKCKLLVLVYLRGNRSGDYMLTPKTRMISIYTLIKQLPRFNYCKFTAEANTLWNEVNKMEMKKSE